MATRFYLPSGGTPAVTPPALPAGWTAGQTAAIQAPMTTTKTDTALTDASMSENTASVTNIPVAVYVSDLLVAQTVSGDVTATIRGMEAASSSDDSLQVGLYLISGDGTTVLSTLYSGHTAALSATSGVLGQEIASAAAATRIIPATALTSQSASAGARLMILVGYRTHDASATARASTLRLGDPTAVADFALTPGLTTDLDPWVELTADLVFGGGGPETVDLTPVSMTLTAVAVTPVSQPVSMSLTPAALTLSAVPVGPVSQPVAVALTPAALTLTAIPVTPASGPVSVTLTPAEVAFTAVAVTPAAAGRVVVVRPNTGTVGRPFIGVVARP